ncbi:hypothetical protein F750_7073 (plasmid) [Streptomyces sp. PAMC 26508]|nr:hypothetical protein F750_7073 [Streptomyces sp. PAMC 26508]
MDLTRLRRAERFWYQDLRPPSLVRRVGGPGREAFQPLSGRDVG